MARMAVSLATYLNADWNDAPAAWIDAVGEN